MVKHSKSKDHEKNNGEKLEDKQKKQAKNIIVFPIFIIGFIIILLSIISIIFPGLIISIAGDSEFIEPFEMGTMGLPLIIVNIIVFSLIILHFNHNLPNSITKSIQRIFSFDISQKYSLVFLGIILASYIAISVNELSVYELNQYGDFRTVERAIEIWPNGESKNVYVTEQLDRHVRMALLVASEEIFHNVKVIPYLASIFLLIVTYFLTIKFSKKNFTGLISVVLVLQSSTFYIYDTIAVYEYFWVLFYVFYIYLIFKKPKISPVFYILSIFSKAIIVLWFPISILVTILSDIPSKTKIFVLIAHIITIIISLIIFQYSDSVYTNVIDIDVSEFWIGFTTLAFNLRFDVLLLLFLLPVSIGLFLKAKNGCKNSISLIVLICGTILVTPVLEMITNFYFVYPYRYIPLVVFFAVGLSSLFSKE